MCIRRKIFCLWFVIAVMFFALALPAPSKAADAELITESLDNYFVPLYPDIYGGIIDKLPEEEVKNISSVLKGIEIFGYFKSMADIASKIDGGDYSGATLDAASAIAKVAISKMADETTKKVLIAGVGISTLPLTLLVTSIDIARASSAAVEASKTALDLERLYYKIEFDPALKNTGRKLGEGDPIRTDQQAVERVWRLIYGDKEFEAIFKTYVTTELGQEWPEPTLWEQITISSDLLREAKLLEEQKRIKSHIAGLLNEMNKVAKKREAAVVVAKQLHEIAATGATFNEAELSKALAAYQYALVKLPEIEKYLGDFPTKAADLKARFDKATSGQLVEIKKEIIGYQVSIRLYAAAVRGFPTVGKYGSTRTSTLNNLKKADTQLAGLYNSIPQSEIDKRLADQNKKIMDEAAALDTGGVDFTFTRYECKKTFDDVKSQFYDKVMSGAAEASDLTGKAKAEITQFTVEMVQKYGKDATENKKKYDDAAAKLADQIKSVQDAYNRATDANQKNALYAQLQKLQKQYTDLAARFDKYLAMFNSTASVDQENCNGAIKEVDKFYEANMSKFQIMLGSVMEQANSASGVYFKFAQNHGVGKYQGAVNFLSAEEIGGLKKMIAEAPPTYAGMDLKFLKDYVKIDKDKALSTGLLDSVKAVKDALWKYLGATNSMRMTYYNTYESSTLPCLKFMESKEAPAAVDATIKALDNAIKAFEAADQTKIPATSGQQFADTLSYLRSYRTGMDNYLKLISLASGLSGAMEQYIAKAKVQNASVAEDSSYISGLWSRFELARQTLEGTIGMSRANAFNWNFSLGTTPPVLSGDTLKKALESSNMLELSKNLGLGLETAIPDGFVEVKAKEGFIVLRVEDVNTLAGKIQSISTADLTAFYGPMHAMRKSAGAEGFLMEAYFSLGNNLWPLFSANPSLEAAGQKLKDTITKQRDVALKNQDVINTAAARFDLILNRLNPAVAAVKQYWAAGNMEGVRTYIMFYDDLRFEYANLKATRADVDSALKELGDIIEAVRGKAITTTPQPVVTTPSPASPQTAAAPTVQQPLAQPTPLPSSASATPAPQTVQPATPTAPAPVSLQPATGAPTAAPQTLPPAIPAATPTPQPAPAQPPASPPVQQPVVPPVQATTQPAVQPSPAAASPASPPKSVEIAEQVPPSSTPAAVDKPASPPAVPSEPKPAPTPVVTQTPPQPVVPEVKETAKSPEPAPAKPEPSPVVTASTPETPKPPPKATEDPKTAIVEAQTATKPQPEVTATPEVPPPPKAADAVKGTVLPQIPAKPEAIKPAGKPKDDPTPKIKALYENMKRGYGSRNLLGFAQCIAPDWQGTDGMTCASLWKNLMQTFKDYNDLHCTIQNLSIEKTAEDRYKTTYDITLSGTLRKTKEKKQEQSTVTEEVRVDKSGRPKIVKTTAGRFWLTRQ